MRTTAERRGAPDRRRAGNFRSNGQPCQRPPSTNPRRGYPDRSNAGSARQLDRRRETRNRLHEQFGFAFTRFVAPVGDSGTRPDSPTEGDFRLESDSPTWYDSTNSRWVNLRSTAQHNGAASIGIWDDGSDFAANNVEDALAELSTSVAVLPVPVEQQFTATTTYTNIHNLAAKPNVSVTDSEGFEIIVCVRHEDVNTVVIYFNGTITDGVLILN